jgi:2,3-bisphosphoglycerate-dependent phosphoglycerate mutase
VTTLYLVRHAAATGQEPEAPLTAEGRFQSGKLAEFFRDIELDLVVSSPYVRAVETILPLAQERGLSVETDPRLKERVLCGRPRDDWMDLLKRSFEDPHLCFEGGESGKEALERALSALKDWTRSSAKNVAIVSHGNLLALILGHFDRRFGFEGWKAMSNPDVYQVRLPEGRVERIWR